MFLSTRTSPSNQCVFIYTLYLHLVLTRQRTCSVIYIAQRLAISEGRILKTQYQLYSCAFRNQAFFKRNALCGDPVRPITRPSAI